KGALKRGITSIILTSAIIIVLILVTPAEAVEVSISTDKKEYSINETVTFNVNINIEDQERVPVKELTLKLNGMEKCKFKPDGEIISGCNNMTITPVQILNYGYGYRQGTGFGFDGTSFGVKQTIYGYGYGYGYAPMEPAELKYEIKWQTGEADWGTYNAILEAFAQNTEESFTYISGTATFKVRKGILATQAKAELRAADGKATDIQGISFLDVEEKSSISFYGDLRSTDSNAAGVIALNVDMYKLDGMHRVLRVRMKPSILKEFHRDFIELEGLAQIEIRTTKKGTKNQKIIDEAHVVVEVDIPNKRAKVYSDDQETPFIIEDIKITQLDYVEYEKKLGIRRGIPTQLLEVFRLSY
ncbi:MAG: hypothetical protein ABIH63_02175, partial [archaeon]